MSQQFCFLDRSRPCDLTCKAAYTTDEDSHEIHCTFIFAVDTFGRLADTLDREKQTLAHLRH